MSAPSRDWAPTDALAIYAGGQWLAETVSGRQLELVERAGGIHICFVTSLSDPPRDWPWVFRFYRDAMRDPIVLVVDSRGVEYRSHEPAEAAS